MAPPLRLLTPLLKNSGSTARDHLASERTFLAWLRTGLGFVALGIAVERFSQLDLSQLQAQPAAVQDTSGAKEQVKKRKEQDDKAQVLVVGLMATGTGSVVYGGVRYARNMRLLERGMFRPSFWGAAGLTVAVLGLTAASVWGVLGDRGGEVYEKSRVR